MRPINMMSFTLALGLLAASGTAQGDVINQDGFDVRLLGAALAPATLTIDNHHSDRTLDYRACDERERTPRYRQGQHAYDSVTLDCSQALSDRLGAPAVNTLELYVNFAPNSAQILSSMPLAKVMHTVIFTASPFGALEPSTGIGFYYKWQTKFVFKNQMKEVGLTQLLNGEPAAVHQFVGLHKQQQDHSVQFKPFMAFDTDRDVYHVWEDLRPRHDHPNVTGAIPGIMGSGNYSLDFHAQDRIQFTDVIRDNRLVNLPRVTPKLGRVDAQRAEVQQTTITHADRSAFEIALYPRWSTSPFYAAFEERKVFAGVEAWFRYKNGPIDRNLKMSYQLNGGEVQEAGHYLGGNCFGYARCFEIELPADVSGELSYWFSDAPDEVYQVPVVGQAGGAIAINADGEVAVTMDERTNALSLVYDVHNALRKALNEGVTPEYLAVTADITQNGETTRNIPVANARTNGHDNGSYHYRGRMAIMPFAIKPWTEGLSVTFKITVNRGGINQGTYSDGPYDITLP